VYYDILSKRELIDFEKKCEECVIAYCSRLNTHGNNTDDDEKEDVIEVFNTINRLIGVLRQRSVINNEVFNKTMIEINDWLITEL
jgi:hypothetical protein